MSRPRHVLNVWSCNKSAWEDSLEWTDFFCVRELSHCEKITQENRQHPKLRGSPRDCYLARECHAKNGIWLCPWEKRDISGVHACVADSLDEGLITFFLSNSSVVDEYFYSVCKSAFFLLPSFLFCICLFSRQYSSCGAQVERLPARTLDPRDPLEIGVKCSSRKIIRDSCLCANMPFPNGLVFSLLTHTVQMKLPMASIWPLTTRSPSHGPLFVRVGVGPFHNWA